MTSVRLLPVVIFAASALLVFKGIGLVTEGGYVFVGTGVVQAAGGGGGGGASKGAEGAADSALVEHSAVDSSPTADDGAPTLSLADEPAGDGHGGAAGGGDSAAAEHGTEAEAGAADHSAAPDAEHGAEAEAGHAAGTETACPPAAEDGEAASDSHSSEAAPAEGGDGHASPAAAPAEPCPPAMPTTADGDALPMMTDSAGNIVPLGDGGGSKEAVIEKLGERRTQLDTQEQDLATRMALVEAAEKRLNERTALLEQLQTQINGLVDQNNASDDAQFKGLVAMYEAMKPKEAAAILNELDLNTLLRVTRGISPRKMAPILAKMDPIKAKDLTTAMAMMPQEPTVSVTEQDIANLPQIVGQ